MTDRINWNEMLLRPAKPRKRELDAAVRKLLGDIYFDNGPLATTEVAEHLWPHREWPHPFSTLCRTLVKMAPFFGPEIATHDGPITISGGRGWRWWPSSYSVEDKLRDEIANNPEQWS